MRHSRYPLHTLITKGQPCISLKRFRWRSSQTIVGLKLKVEKIEGKFKLGQNRSLADRQAVRAGLMQRTDAASLQMDEMMSVD